jgi:hypothetical protein
MTEPTSATTAVSLGIASGTAGAVLVGLGLSWPVLIWGSVGCIVGLSWAPATGRWRALSLFGAASLLSAKAGTMGAVLWFAASPEYAQGMSAGVGMVFHPLLSAVVAKIPEAVSRRLAP